MESGRCEEERTMKMTITAKKMQIPQNFTEYAEKRLNSKLNKQTQRLQWQHTRI